LNRPDLQDVLGGAGSLEWAEGNIENATGQVSLPVGVVGPLRVNGLFANGDYWVPLATSEAALVASYHRGAQLLTAAGGCTAMLLSEGISRVPALVFSGMIEAGKFAAWIVGQLEKMREVASTVTRHGKLEDMSLTLEGNIVWLHLEYYTGDASGQNMVTICTEAICNFIREHSPVKPRQMYVEGNMSGDKKASAQAFVGVRGKKVVAETHITRELLHKYLHVTPEMLVDYWRVSALGGIQSGSIGIHGHLANGLAALYLATGQDVACVAESAIGVTHFEPQGEGIYAAVTLPAIMVGTVGGGTKLPTQHAWLELMGLAGNGKSRALAEVCAGLLLAGELSIIAALAAGQFTKAHAKLARKNK
jgi:hydroxymethylglutaryl-CoA reductase (NADPH)